MRTDLKNLKLARNINMGQIRIEGIRWSSYDQRTWLGTTPYMVYTIEPGVRGWVLDAGGGKETYPTIDAAKQRALEDHVSRAKQALRIKGWKYEERIGGV